MIQNEDQLRKKVFHFTEDQDELKNDYLSQNPSNLSDRYQIKKILEDMNTAVNNLSNSTLDNFGNQLRVLAQSFKPFLRVQNLLLQKVYQLDNQVALQDKLLGALLCNEPARESLKRDLETSTLDNLSKMELMEQINRISSYENNNINVNTE